MLDLGVCICVFCKRERERERERECVRFGLQMCKYKGFVLDCTFSLQVGAYVK
jgi:hypothetical protein